MLDTNEIEYDSIEVEQRVERTSSRKTTQVNEKLGQQLPVKKMIDTALAIRIQQPNALPLVGAVCLKTPNLFTF